MQCHAALRALLIAHAFATPTAGYYVGGRSRSSRRDGRVENPVHTAEASPAVNPANATLPADTAMEEPDEEALTGQHVMNAGRKVLDVGGHVFNRGKDILDTKLPPIFNTHELEGDTALNSVHGVASHVVLPGMFVLAFVTLVGAWMGLQRLTALIPASAWQVFLAALFGSCVRGLLDAGVISDTKYVWFSATALNLFLLPIIIFQSGWALNHFNFLSQLEYIQIFAVFGTLINFVFIGLVGYWLGQNGWVIVTDLREHLAFSALISAVDPVATLSTFSKLGLDQSQPLLHTMIFGESVINDAVAIVLFHTINHSWDTLTVGQCLGDIVYLLFGSACFGILAASLLVWFQRIARLPGDTIPETLYIIACAWLIFAAAESMSFSGIIANLCAGSIFRMYGAMHLEASGLHRTDEFLEVCAHLMDSLVFILVGISTALMNSWRGLKFGIYAFILCEVGRAISTSTCAVGCNAIKTCMQEPSEHKITFKHQCMMWHAGLRGGIALLLALELDNTWCTHKATLINATFFVICATLVLLGSTTEPFLRVLGFYADSPSQQEEGVAFDHDFGDHKDTSTVSLMEHGDMRHRKKAIVMSIHSAFKHCLVGDLEYCKQKRQEARDFLESRATQENPGSSTTAA